LQLTGAGGTQVGLGLQVERFVNMPPVQVSAAQVVPFGARLSPGQFGPLPGQFSPMSHGPLAARHTVVEERYAAGQLLDVPSQTSSASQGAPPEARQMNPAERFRSLGHAALVPLHTSVRSQGPAAARQVVFAGEKPSPGQPSPVPVHSSATSQPPFAARHTVLLEALASLGHAALRPVQLSATSHTPAAARQTVVDERKASDGQLALLPLQVSAWSHGPAEARHTVEGVLKLQVPTEPVRLHASHVPLHAVLQQNPSTQKPDEHWRSVPHEVPRPCFGRHIPPPQYWLTGSGHEAVSAGQLTPLPGQLSAGSHPPVELRHT
jgi:hypothetical protein